MVKLLIQVHLDIAGMLQNGLNSRIIIESELSLKKNMLNATMAPKTMNFLTMTVNIAWKQIKSFSCSCHSSASARHPSHFR
jgi:hypothetical protein